VLEYANTLSPSSEVRIFSVCRITHLLKRRTDELSGGEKQRIAIARLLIQQPKLLLLDEPFSNLDRMLKSILKEVIDDIGRKLRITCILVSHDPEDTLPWADEILVLKSGKIIQRGSPQKIYHQPVNRYVAGLFGMFNTLNADWIKKFGIKTASKKIIVRPENFQLTTKGAKTVSGYIDKIHFYGNHWLLEVFAKEQRIYVIANNHLTPGDCVHMKLTLA
jgi:ABC-type Fe3+/spermidine/putrescine transport system ATPase subunit